jgi:hypothetical protein
MQHKVDGKASIALRRLNASEIALCDVVASCAPMDHLSIRFNTPHSQAAVAWAVRQTR